MSQVGLPQQQYNNQLNNINQNQSAGISALNNSANPGANIASVVRAGDNATGALNAQDAVARNNNMLQLLKQRQVLAQQKDKAWDWNYQQKYLGNLAKSQALQGAGNANLNGALNDASSAATTLGKMGAFSNSTQTMGQKLGNEQIDAGQTPGLSDWQNFSMSGGNQNTFQ